MRVALIVAVSLSEVFMDLREGGAFDSLVSTITTAINDVKAPVLTVAGAAVVILGIFLGIRYIVKATKSVK